MELRRLRASAIGYFREQLAAGSTLSKALLECDLTHGEIWAVVAGSTSDERAHRLDAGGITTATRPPPGSPPLTMVRVERPSLPFLIRLVARYLQATPGAHCVFEDARRRRGDPISRRSLDVEHRYFGDEVYYVLGSDQADDALIERAFRAGESYVLLAALAPLPGRATLLQPHDIDVEALRVVAEATEVIIVSAYDHEGFAVWTKDASIANRLTPPQDARKSSTSRS